ncbi:MAG: ankyrin repeat domain-containing protein [Gammaproteobacteria bacterium]|nr:MAG: ankyrin repeat domain-containing protein [Gammaproteobacteria bacterium]
MREVSGTSPPPVNPPGDRPRLSGSSPFLAVLGVFVSLIVVSLVVGAWQDRQPEWQLRQAVLDDDLPRVEALLSQGAPVNRILTSSTVLHHAAWAGKTDLVRMLLAHGADPNIRSTHHGETALHSAVRGNAPEIVALLLDAGAHTWIELHADSEQCVTGVIYPAGSSPEDIARQGGYHEVLALLRHR